MVAEKKAKKTEIAEKESLVQKQLAADNLGVESFPVKPINQQVAVCNCACGTHHPEELCLCDEFNPHLDVVEQGKVVVANTVGMGDFFKALADETRIKIVYSLLWAGELCVCDLAEIAGVTVAAASHHLRLLYQMGLAKAAKRGKFVYYSLDDGHVGCILQQALEHIRHKGVQ